MKERGLTWVAIWVAVTYIQCGALGDRIVLQSAPATTSETERTVNGGFEADTSAPLAEWAFWQRGYELDPQDGRGGTRGIVCRCGDPHVQYGASQIVTLNQTQPRAIVVTGWSRSEGVEGTTDNGYAIYLDLVLADGTPLWGQTACFSTGTHDWQQRRCFVMPVKPIEKVFVHALFRGHRGTAWFDDFSLTELPDDASLFEGAPVNMPAAARQAAVAPCHEIATPSGLKLAIEPSSGVISSLSLNEKLLGGDAVLAFVRDVQAESPFLAPDAWTLSPMDEGLCMIGEITTLALRLDLTLTPRGNYIDVAGRVTDLRGTDRAVTAYVAFPVAGKEWIWSDDARHDRPAPRGVFTRVRSTGAGATGTRSTYPLAAISGPSGGLALAVPLAEPRHHRLGYDADHGLFFAAFDFGLCAETTKFPSSAAYRVVLYPFDPAWRFRAALDRYYRLFPDSFVKRVQTEGLWMAFTDIGSVKGWQDFGFAYHEGTNAVPWDKRNGILSFVYTEPMTTWVPMPKEIPRTKEGSTQYLAELLAKPELGKRAEASKTRLSAARDLGNEMILSVEDAPWCNGSVFALNADPDLPTTVDDPINQAQYAFQQIDAAMSKDAPPVAGGWDRFGDGYAIDSAVHSEGGQSIRVSATQTGRAAGAMQQVELNQTEPKPLTVRARVRCENVTGAPDVDFSIYVDLVHADGTPLFAQAVPIPPGNGGFQLLERTITSDKPFQRATVFLLMRNNHTGTAWFDDVFLGATGSDVNRLANPGAEGPLESPRQVDGTYIDSYEFWANTLNYNRAHFASVDIPLVFEPNTRAPGIFMVFSTFEFERELAARMHVRDKLVMANGVLLTYDFPAHGLDVLGTETNWFPNGRWGPMSDEELLFKRALAFQRPYCFLMNAHYADLTPELVERYMQRSLFYGMFPGFFSENAATHCYFESPEWYDAARPLFKKYVPLVRRIAQAGWQPVTHARASVEGLLLERYGDPSQSAVYLTALNDTADPITATVNVDLRALGWSGKNVLARDLLADTDVRTTCDAERLSYDVTLAAQTVALAFLSAEP